METEFWLRVMLRALPSIIVFVLAFIVAADKKSRERWAEWMYQIGNIRNDQRSDPKVQSGVRLPFFVVAVLLLIIPVRFYWLIGPTRNVRIVPQASVVPTNTTPAGAAPTTRGTPGSTPAPVPTAPPVSSGPISVK